MSSFRESAITSLSAKPHILSNENYESVQTIIDSYAEDVFNATKMEQVLQKDTYQKLINTIQDGATLDPSIADEVAMAMKNWAISKGVTHFTHWFQPLTGTTAEKHDAFLEPDNDGKFIANFSGKNLVIGESDASSFPSGGLRSTFEARGYTAWDPTSPAFIRRNSNGATLCIPTAFCSFNCLALDKKTPLLRSIQILKKAVKHLMASFHADSPNAHVTIGLGAEQEYFLIDRNFYFARPDLVQTGRTLFGAPPPKHQQLDDHYFGCIHPRVLAFMVDVEKKLWRLGIPAKTRHNEVAPGQFELAPLFEEINLAVDHNMLIMEILRQTAEKHGFVCLLHEKPFEGVNGSGKHNNWSVSYGKTNLLNPGNNPKENAIFLTTLCAVIRAVDEHSDLLRASTAFYGNDRRLGANEAPPSIISIFLGSQLVEILEKIGISDKEQKNNSFSNLSTLEIGVDALPQLPLDSSDRNRTSPFAFTNNKFEFRAPGSSQTCAGISTVLNMIVADSIEKMAGDIDSFSNDSNNFTEKLNLLLADVYQKHKRIIFNGNGYTQEWLHEAIEERKLPYASNTPEALLALKQEKNIDFFEATGILSKEELLSRYEIYLNNYRNHVRIEGSLTLLMARTIIMPAALKYLSSLSPLETNNLTSSFISETKDKLIKLVDQMEEKNKILDHALNNHSNQETTICQTMEEIRKYSDELEHIVADDLWPLPKYREMLFLS